MGGVQKFGYLRPQNLNRQICVHKFDYLRLFWLVLDSPKSNLRCAILRSGRNLPFWDITWPFLSEFDYLIRANLDDFPNTKHQELPGPPNIGEEAGCDFLTISTL